MSGVMQDWTASIPMMQQTVLITAVRGPDGVTKYHPSKYLLRWYRRCVLLSAMDGAILPNPYLTNGGSFTGPSFTQDELRAIHDAGTLRWETEMDEVVGRYLQSLDELPHHFQLHLMHAIEIVGYKHPDERIRTWWHGVYLRLVRDMHLQPETEETLDHRLGDNRAQWLAHNDEATVS